VKILMTTDTVGGVWTYVMELARALEPLDVEIILATMGPRANAAQIGEAAALANVTLCQSNWKLEWMDEPWEEVAAAGRWLLGLEEKYRPDVIHLNGYAHGALPWRAPVIVVGHSCVLSWWEAVKGKPAPAEWARYQAEVTAGIRRADVLIAPSREMLRALGQFYGPLPPSRVIYNARDAKPFSARRKRPLILSAGRLWDEAKNLNALEQMAGELNWPIYVAGDEQSPQGGGTAARSTRALGRLNEKAMARWLGMAAIYCLPARYEPFGLSVLEAALAGCALVLGEIASLREIWGDAAVFVQPDDTEGLERELSLLMQDGKRRSELGERARERAARYTPSRMVKAYLSIYRHLAAAAATPAINASVGTAIGFAAPDYMYRV